MKKIRIEPYKTWSGGAKALGLRAGILRATNKQVQKHGDFDVIINWGRSERRFNGEYINNPEAVVSASDKLRACKRFAEAGIPAPSFTTSRSDAEAWVQDGSDVVVRHLLRANGGRGIVLVGPEGSEIASTHEVPNAPLYVKYVKKAAEYRVHVFDGDVIDLQQKRRKVEVPDEQVNWQIRNHSNGWIFARTDVGAPDCVLGSAVAAVATLGLDFGAVDIGFNEHTQTPSVYEVNTAPGLEGQTLDAYYNALVKRFPSLRSGMYAKRRAV